jgi:hypothetical protein
MLAIGAERLAAGSQDPQARGRPGQCTEHLRGGTDDVFAVVNHYEQAASAECHSGGRDQIAGLVADAKPTRDNSADITSCRRRKLDHSCLAAPATGGLQRQARLAASRRADQADKRAGSQHAVQFSGAPSRRSGGCRACGPLALGDEVWSPAGVPGAAWVPASCAPPRPPARAATIGA